MRYAIISIVIAMLAAAGYGQSCDSSHLSYIVRDKKGVAIDDKRAALSFDKDTGAQFASNWAFEDKVFRYENVKAPSKIKAVFGKTKWLEASRMCSFNGPVKLKITLDGEVMELTFDTPRLRDQEWRNFLVDSIPFKAGKYRIMLGLPTNDYSVFYSANGWKRS